MRWAIQDFVSMRQGLLQVAPRSSPSPQVADATAANRTSLKLGREVFDASVTSLVVVEGEHHVSECRDRRQPVRPACTTQGDEPESSDGEAQCVDWRLGDDQAISGEGTRCGEHPSFFGPYDFPLGSSRPSM